MDLSYIQTFHKQTLGDFLEFIEKYKHSDKIDITSYNNKEERENFLNACKNLSQKFSKHLENQEFSDDKSKITAYREFYRNSVESFHESLFRNYEVPKKIATQKIIQVCNDNKIKNILDFGFGSGSDLLSYEENGIKATGYDINQFCKDFTLFRIKKHKSSATLVDKLIEGTHYDAIICSYSLEYHPFPDKLVKYLSKFADTIIIIKAFRIHEEEKGGQTYHSNIKNSIFNQSLEDCGLKRQKIIGYSFPPLFFSRKEIIHNAQVLIELPTKIDRRKKEFKNTPKPTNSSKNPIKIEEKTADIVWSKKLNCILKQNEFYVCLMYGGKKDPWNLYIVVENELWDSSKKYPRLLTKLFAEPNSTDKKLVATLLHPNNWKKIQKGCAEQSKSMFEYLSKKLDINCVVKIRKTKNET